MWLPQLLSLFERFLPVPAIVLVKGTHQRRITKVEKPCTRHCIIINIIRRKGIVGSWIMKKNLSMPRGAMTTEYEVVAVPSTRIPSSIP
jgi:hypothetical protein